MAVGSSQVIDLKMTISLTYFTVSCSKGPKRRIGRDYFVSGRAKSVCENTLLSIVDPNQTKVPSTSRNISR
jgi:hypothetical protein